MLLADEDVVRPAGILGSAGRSDFVVWMMPSILFVMLLKVGSSAVSQPKSGNTTTTPGRSQRKRHVHFF